MYIFVFSLHSLASLSLSFYSFQSIFLSIILPFDSEFFFIFQLGNRTYISCWEATIQALLRMRRSLLPPRLVMEQTADLPLLTSDRLFCSSRIFLLEFLRMIYLVKKLRLKFC